uniref:Uncharacterized protein n=1 Tax=Chaetoceros debilis TaxID=122233 RepID=A0A7S3PXG4_9STRA
MASLHSIDANVTNHKAAAIGFCEDEDWEEKTDKDDLSAPFEFRSYLEIEKEDDICKSEISTGDVTVLISNTHSHQDSLPSSDTDRNDCGPLEDVSVELFPPQDGDIQTMLDEPTPTKSGFDSDQESRTAQETQSTVDDDDELSDSREYIDLSQHYYNQQCPNGSGLSHDQYILHKDIFPQQMGSQPNLGPVVESKNQFLFENLDRSFDKCLPPGEENIPQFSSLELKEIAQMCFSAMCVVFSSQNPSSTKFADESFSNYLSDESGEKSFILKGSNEKQARSVTKKGNQYRSEIIERHQRRLASEGFTGYVYGGDTSCSYSVNTDAMSSHAANSSVDDSYRTSTPDETGDTEQRGPMVPQAVVYMLWSKLILVRFHDRKGSKNKKDDANILPDKCMPIILNCVKETLVEMALLEACHQEGTVKESPISEPIESIACLRTNHRIHLQYGLYMSQNYRLYPFFLRSYQQDDIGKQRPKSPYHIFDEESWNPEHALNFIMAASCLSRVQQYKEKKNTVLKKYQKLQYEYSMEMLPWHLMRSLQYKVVAGILSDLSFVKGRIAILEFSDAAAMQVADLEELHDRISDLVTANPSLPIEMDLYQTITECYGMVGSLIRSKDKFRKFYEEKDEQVKMPKELNDEVDLENVLSVSIALQTLGDSLFRFNLHAESMKYYYRAMVRYEHVNAIETKRGPSLGFNKAQFFMGGILSRIASVYACENSFGDAMLCYEKSLSFYSRCQSKQHMKCIARTLASMGQMHITLKEYDPALSCFNEALTIWQSMDENIDEVANLLLVMGNVRREMDDVDESLELFSEALYDKVLVYGKYHPEVAFIHHRIGMSYCDKPDFEKAISHFESALSIRKSAVETMRSQLPVGDKSGRIHSRELEACDTLECIGKIHETMEDIHSAFAYYEESASAHRTHLMDLASSNNCSMTLNEILGVLISEPDSSIFVEDIYFQLETAKNVGLKICPLGGIFRNDVDVEVEGQMADILLDMGMIRGAQYLQNATTEEENNVQRKVKDFTNERNVATSHLEDSILLRERSIERLENEGVPEDEELINYERISIAITLYELGKLFAWFVMRNDIDHQGPQQLPLISSSRNIALRNCRSALKYFEEAHSILQGSVSIAESLSNGREEKDVFSSRLEVTPTIYEEMLQTMAILYRKLGNYDKSVECYNEVSILLTRMELNDDTEAGPETRVVSQKEKVALSSQSIGDILFDTGEFTRALESYEEALQLRKALEGDSLQLADTLSRIGSVLLKLKRWDEAALTFDEALRIRVDQLSQDHHDIAETFHCIGKAYEGHEKLEQALDYYKKAQRIMSGRLVDTDTTAAELFYDLGKIVLLQDDAAELFKRDPPAEDDISLALTCLALCRDIYTRNFGDSALEVGNALNLLGMIYNKYGEYNKAVSSYRSALKIYRGAPLDQSLKICRSLVNLGISLSQTITEEDDGEEMLECFNLAQDLYEEKGVGRQNEDYSKLVLALGEAYLSKGLIDEAMCQFQEALTCYREIFGKDHASTARPLTKLGICFIRNRNHKEAMALLDEALQFYKCCGRVDDLLYAEIHFNKGIILCETGQLNKAIDAYEISKGIRQQKLGDDSIEVAQVLNNIGSVLARNKEYQRALRPWRDAIGIYKSLGVGEDDAKVSCTRGNIAISKNLLSPSPTENRLRKIDVY